MFLLTKKLSQVSPCTERQHLNLMIVSVNVSASSRTMIRWDMVAQDAEYHIKCLVSLYNRARKPNPYTKTDVDSLNYGIAFSELVSYIEETRIDSLVAPIFKLPDLQRPTHFFEYLTRSPRLFLGSLPQTILTIQGGSLYICGTETGSRTVRHVCSERLVCQTKPISDPIKKGNLPLFSRPPLREKTKSQLQLTSLKSDRNLFSRLYVASQVRNGNLDEFFEHENQVYPPALSHNGKMRTVTKSDLVGCLEKLIPTQEIASIPSAEVVILDGSDIVNMLRSDPAKTLSEYVTQVFVPYMYYPSCSMQSELMLFGTSTTPIA